MTREGHQQRKHRTLKISLMAVNNNTYMQGIKFITPNAFAYIFRIILYFGKSWPCNVARKHHNTIIIVCFVPTSPHYCPPWHLVNDHRSSRPNICNEPLLQALCFLWLTFNFFVCFFSVKALVVFKKRVIFDFLTLFFCFIHFSYDFYVLKMLAIVFLIHERNN